MGKMGRTDEGSRLIKAAPETIYRACLDPASVAAWRAPKGMKAEVLAFEPRPGGAVRMALTYETPDHERAGKTSEHTDVVEGRFVELVPDRRVVEDVEFASTDPAFAGVMRVVTLIEPAEGGARVTLRCEDVPPG